MKDTNIEWAHHTFNPWIGCEKVSAGCKNCYAESLNARHKWSEWGPGGKRKKTSDAYWKQPLQWNAACKKQGIRERVFCASLADVFEDHPAVKEWRDELFELVAKTPHLDWLILTKRPRAMRDFFLGESGMGANAFDAGVWNNLWLGTSAEDQRAWDMRVPVLLDIPAKVRFVSAEPLLGRIDMMRNVTGHRFPEWLIVGGESGPNARPMHPEWVRSLEIQSRTRIPHFFFKQWGEWLPDSQRGFSVDTEVLSWGLVHENGSCRKVMERGKRVDNSDPSWKNLETGTARVGKKKAGRMLDGEIHNAIPFYGEGV